MPSITRTAEHQLGRAEAERRVTDFLREAGERFDVASERRDGGFEFRFVTQGVRVSGRVVVTPTEVRLRATLPLLAMPFAGWTTRILRMALEERGPAPPAPAPQVEGPQVEGAGGEAPGPVLLFVHVPKAAGTTMKGYLFAQCRSGRGAPSAPPSEGLYQEGVYYAPFGFFQADGPPAPDYARPYLRDPALRAVLGHIRYGIHELIPRPAQYLTMLRHPVERVLSLYSFLRADDHTTLRGFLESETYRELDNDQTRRIAGVHPPFGGVTEAEAERAEANLDAHFVAVGVSERFDESMLLVRHAMGWADPFTSHARNVTPHRLSEADVSADDRRLIMDLNRWDLRLYKRAVERLDAGLAELEPPLADELRAYRRRTAS